MLAAGGPEELLAHDPAQSVREHTWSFDIPPQTVVSALQSWSAVTGRDWGYVGDSPLKGVRSSGVQGRLTGREALDRLLAGTGLRYVVLPDGSISISRKGSGDGQGGTV
ncbi:MAG: STN domain-containing protein [bacterium]